MTNNLTQGKPSKVLFFFALPMLLGNIFQQLYNLADSIIVGKFNGSDALAAVGGTFPITFLAIGIATGASTGCSIIISHAFGAGDRKKVLTGISTAIISVSSIGLFIFISSFVFLKPLLKFLNTPEQIFDASYSYLRIVFMGCFFLFLYNCLTAVFNALGDSKTPLKFLMFSTLINIVLDLLFVVKFNMGTDGAGYATLISQSLSAISLFVYFLRKVKDIKADETPKMFDKIIAKEMFLFAIPSIIQQTMVSIGMMAVQGLVNSYGKDMVAGYTAATKIDSIAVMPMINISVALSTYTAQNIGAKNIERVKQGFFAALKMAVIFALFISAILVLFGNNFIQFFIDSKSSRDVITYGSDYFHIVSIFYFIMGIMFCSSGILRGIGAMKVFMICSFVNIVSRIAFAYLLSPILGYKAIFWALPIGWFLGGLISTLYIKKGTWKNKFLVKCELD